MRKHNMNFSKEFMQNKEGERERESEGEKSHNFFTELIRGMLKYNYISPLPSPPQGLNYTKVIYWSLYAVDSFVGTCLIDFEINWDRRGGEERER